MSNAYLDIAETVLRRRRVPLTPNEMLADAYLSGEVPRHLHGNTQEKTLQARLSEDIARLRDGSLFFRTNRARFFLRELISDDTLPGHYRIEYFARPRRKDLRRERVLVLERGAILSNQMSSTQLDQIFKDQRYKFLTWNEVGDRSDVLPVYSFLVIHRGTEVLSYSSGKFTAEDHPSKGMKSVGFGSAVRAQDSDLLFNAYHGIIGSAINELVYSLGLQREHARQARYENQLVLHWAVCTNGNLGQSFVKIVLSYRAPNDFLPTKSALSLNKLEWLNAKTSPRFVEQFDGLSQVLFASGTLAKIARDFS